ncbi:ABC transporter permease [Ruminococcus gauvreauii]|uniref:ABC transporter permease n=1 Tax=Ruminococcus gauvreauii TaxID=438033 RepID=A0ABY5VEU6_9FIRM|nr:ABC transporter permease [Ruminococcus gauvreauii]UWP58792.1 ABC transporter permease [Ruminococcus gauvreauii]
MRKTKKKFSFAEFYSKFGVVTILIVVFVIASLLSGNFLKPANLTNVLRQIVVVTVIGCGACFVLITAQINIAYDSLIACVGCTSCLVMIHTGSVFLAVIVGIALGAVIGLFYGFCVAKLSMPGFIVGLAIDTIASGAILLATNGNPISGLGKFTVIGQGYIGFVPISVIIMFGVLVVSYVLLNMTCFGRQVMAVGGNKQAAIASGINVDRVIILVYIYDGIMTAIAAIIFMSRLSSGQPSAGVGYAFDAITAVVVGGVSIYGGSGNVIGTIVGAAIVGILNNLMNLLNVTSYWQNIVSGIVILLAVLMDVMTKRASANAIKNAMADRTEKAA